MTTITFSQSKSCQWLYLANDAQSVTLFLLPPDSENLPVQISLAESWKDYSSGCYIFLRSAILEGDQAVFARAAWAFLSDPTRRERSQPSPFFPRTDPRFFPRFAWFSNPGEAAIGLSGQSISLYMSDSSEWRSDRLNSFESGGYVLRIVKNCTVDLKTDGSSFEFSPLTGFVNEYQPPEMSLERISPVVVSLRVGGENNGAFFITRRLSNVKEIEDFFTTFQPEIRYFFTDSNSSLPSPRITSLQYPIFSDIPADWAGLQGELVVQSYIYPNQLMDDHEIIISPTMTGNNLPTHFRTNLGYPVHLISVGDFKLISAFWQDGGQKHFYLTAEGAFEIYIPGKPDKAPANLICGLSGVEYIHLPSDKKNILTFIPGQPAFAPAFSLEQNQDNNDGGSEKLNNKATTSWVYISQQDMKSGSEQSHPIYFAQPDQAVLYRPFKDSKGDTGDFLEYLDVPAVALPPQVDNLPPYAFPVAPYGKADPALIADYQKFEARLLTPARRDALERITSSQTLPLVEMPNPYSVIGTTPQGLMATYSGDYEKIQSLVLAKDTAENFLKFTEIERSSPLRAALQSSQLFLVISNPESISKYFKDNKLAIKDWTFNLDPDYWQDHNTLLVIKFHNHSMQDLVANSHAWTMAEKFSAKPEMDRSALNDIFQQALDKVNGNSTSLQDIENYEQLVEAISSPRWNGILAFNVTVPPGGLPPELVGLTSGIDENRFCAQYVGIASSKVHVSQNQLEIQKSSLFGLIDYVDDGGVAADNSGYNFAVSKLNVLFRNSEVKHFAGEVVLVLDKLFGEETALQNSVSGRNEILLVGRCESHDGINTYSFSSSDFSRFDLPKSPIINEVEIVKTQFCTDPPANRSSYVNGESVKSRFAFWGRLDFINMTGNSGSSNVTRKKNSDQATEFDILSFGSVSNDGEGGASFSNMQVTSSFPWKDIDDGGQPGNGGNPEKSFAFNAGGMIFNLAKSKRRPNSLFAKFPLKLIGMVEGDGSPGQKTPDSLGFMPVRTPLGEEKPANDKPWFGLLYDLKLGSSGALAGKAEIVVNLLAAWTPGADSKVYTGLRLPGSSGGKKEIPIQGILKIAFKSIEFKGLSATSGYLLKLKNIVLKFMVLELPPNAQSEIIIFGDPKGENSENTLAWYAAYASTKSKTAPKKLPKEMFS